MGCYKLTYCSATEIPSHRGQPGINVQRVRCGKASREKNVEWVWLSVDPLAHEFPSWTPFNYVLNNPVNLIDQDGRAPGDPVKNPRIRPTTNSGVRGGMFGMTRSGGTQFHNGVDILAPKGTPLQSLKGGSVFSKGTHKNLGNFVIIQSELDDGTTLYSAYAHLDEPTALDYGQSVNEGDIVGNAGRTGNARDLSEDQEHVHIYTKVSKDGKYSNAEFTDPLKYFDTQFDSDGQPIPNNPLPSIPPPIDSSLEGGPEIY